MKDGDAYRSATTGDKGFIETSNGKQYVVLDRPGHAVRRLYKAGEWIKEAEHRPLLPQQIGVIKFMAEKYLLMAVGDPEGHKMNWMLMTNIQRSDYMEEDSHHALVRRMHDVMSEVLDPLGE